MRMTEAGVLPSFALILAACQAEAPSAQDDRTAARRPPEPACIQARSELERQGGTGSLIVSGDGEAMIERRAWMGLDQNGRDRIIERLAVLVACSAETPQREVEVVLRDEGGRTITSRYVRPSTDFRAD